MDKTCKICGNTFTTIPNGGSRKYCFDCSPSYPKGDSTARGQAITHFRRALKRHFINIKGGKCQRCGYNKCASALEFHHLDPREKDFSIGHYLSGTNIDIEKALEEVQKCILLCANCHREEHENNGLVTETD